MGRRLDDRTPNELSIRIWGMDSAGRPFSSQARTIDITRTGARITGIEHICQKGDVIGIQHGEQKARFRVVWVGNPGSAKAGQVGVHCVESGKYIWGVQLPDRKWAIDPHPIPGMGSVVALADNIVSRDSMGMKVSKLPPVKPGARRVHRRVSCTGSLEISPEGGAAKLQALLSDISASGCYAELGNPLPVNTRVQFDMRIRQRELRGHGIVRQCHPGVGMGISFTEMSPHDRDLLSTIVSSLDHAVAVSKPDRLAKAMAAAKEGIPTPPSSRRLGPPTAEPTTPTPPPAPVLRSKAASAGGAGIPDVTARSSVADSTPTPKTYTPPPTTTPVPPLANRPKVPAQQPGTPAPASASRPKALSQEPTLLEKLSRIRSEFKDLHEELISDHVDPRLAQDFKDSIDHARQAAWTLEQWLQLEAEKRDPYEVMPHLDAERVKHTHRLAKRLAVGIDATEIGDHTAGLEGLFNAIDELRTRLARLIKKEMPKDKELKSNLRGSDTTSIF